MGHPRVFLYAEPTVASLDVTALAAYVRGLFPRSEVTTRDSFIRFHLSLTGARRRRSAGKDCREALSRIALQFARAKVRNPSRPFQEFIPLPGEVDYELRRLSDAGSKIWGILYDGYRMMSLFRELVPQQERGLDHIHVVFTNQLFGTWEDGDRRYHARASVYGFPSIISTTGIVEAPARPREYYLLKQQYVALGMPDATAILEDRFKEQRIVHNDERLTEVMKGYVMQAIAYSKWGDPFCSDKGCRLYNAHWQQEVIQAQLGNKREFCAIHWRTLKEKGLRDES